MKQMNNRCHGIYLARVYDFFALNKNVIPRKYSRKQVQSTANCPAIKTNFIDPL